MSTCGQANGSSVHQTERIACHHIIMIVVKPSSSPDVRLDATTAHSTACLPAFKLLCRQAGQLVVWLIARLSGWHSYPLARCNSAEAKHREDACPLFAFAELAIFAIWPAGHECILDCIARGRDRKSVV